MKTFVLLTAVLAAALLVGCVEETTTLNTGVAGTPGSNERAYYDDGCVAGTQDAKASMSSVYERYADDYDTRFEPYFQQGYKTCWAENR
jgi:hypothetical protein